MSDETNVFDSALLVFAILADLLAVAICAGLIVTKIRQTQFLKSYLIVAWWPLVLLAGCAIVYLIWTYFTTSHGDVPGRMMLYVLAMVLSPIIASGLLALFFRP
jgi:hypothetical protein